MILARRMLPGAEAALLLPSFAQVLPEGRLVELSGAAGAARTTLAFAAVREAQLRGDSVAWIQGSGGLLYPPDAAECGVDLGALVVVQVPRACGEAGEFRAAEILLRSGGFGLIVVDLRGAPRATTAMQGRLQALAREHELRVLLITDHSTASDSLGPLVGLRVEPKRSKLGGGRFAIEPIVIKSKQGPLELATSLRLGPWSPR